MPRPVSLFADLRSLPRAFWILFAGIFINRFGTFVWPFLTIYLTRQGHSLAESSIAMSGLGVGSLFGGVLGGWLADHLGRRKTIVFGTFGTAIFMMVLYTAQTLPALFATTTLIGIFSGSYHPAAQALLADLVPEHQRVRAFAAVRLAANAGFALGTATGGILVNFSTFWLFAGDAISTCVYGSIAFLWLPHGLRGQTAHTPWRAALSAFAGHKAFHYLWAGTLCAAIVTMQTASTFSLYITRSGVTADFLGVHLTPEIIYGLVIGWNGTMIVLFELPLTNWTLRFNERHVIALGFLIQGCGFALNAFAHSTFALWLIMTIYTLGEMLNAAMSSAFVARIAPEAMRGRYMGALALAWNTATVTGPLVGFWLFAFDPRTLWAASALLGIVAAWCVLRARVATPGPATLPPLDPDPSHAVE